MNDKVKNIHAGHRKRLRTQFLSTDYTNMPEHQILELMLTFVQPLKDVNPLAHNLLNEFGNLANVLDASLEDLKAVKGIGDVTANYINFCSRLPEIYRISKARKNTKINNPGEIVSFLSTTGDFASVEKFYYICLNGKGEVLCFKTMGSGSVSRLFVNNRELIQQILKYPTHSVVICHTHPHGMPKPSTEDRKFTRELNDLLSSLSVRLLDHVILSPDGYFSFFQAKLLGQETLLKEFRDLQMNLYDGGSDYFYAEKKD